MLSSIRGKTAFLACVASAPLALPSLAHAGFVATLASYGPGQYSSCGYRASDSWDSSSALSMYSIRSYQHQFISATGEERLTWCAEIYQGVSVGSTYDFTEVSVEAVPGQQPGPMGIVRASVIRDLFARWIDPTTMLVIGDAADRNAKSAAFQLAIWEITHENFTATDASGVVSQMSLAQGAFRSAPNGAAASWYAAMRASLGQGGFLGANLGGLTHPTAQDQIFAPHLPAPGALALLGIGGALLGRRRR